MTALRVGMRVKKVRGKMVGMTGCVVALEAHSTNPVFDCRIRCDAAWLNTSGRMKPPSVIANCVKSQWEPIILADDNACEADFKESLDRLLEREGVSA